MRGWMLTLALAVASPASASSSASVPPPNELELARDMLKGLVEINTTHAHGSTEAAQAIHGWLLSAGFAAGDVVFLAPPESPTKGALLETGSAAADMHAVAQSPLDLAAAERLSRNVRLNAQLRTTCVATLISGGHAENALPQRAKATIQRRPS